MFPISWLSFSQNMNSLSIDPTAPFFSSNQVPVVFPPRQLLFDQSHSKPVAARQQIGRLKRVDQSNKSIGLLKMFGMCADWGCALLTWNKGQAQTKLKSKKKLTVRGLFSISSSIGQVILDMCCIIKHAMKIRSLSGWENPLISRIETVTGFPSSV